MFGKSELILRLKGLREYMTVKQYDYYELDGLRTKSESLKKSLSFGWNFLYSAISAIALIWSVLGFVMQYGSGSFINEKYKIIIMPFKGCNYILAIFAFVYFFSMFFYYKSQKKTTLAEIEKVDALINQKQYELLNYYSAYKSGPIVTFYYSNPIVIGLIINELEVNENMTLSEAEKIILKRMKL